jgi:hypothetical protein
MTRPRCLVHRLYPQLSTAVATGDPHCSGRPRCSLNGRVIGGQYYRTKHATALPIWKTRWIGPWTVPFRHFFPAKNKLHLRRADYGA